MICLDTNPSCRNVRAKALILQKEHPLYREMTTVIWPWSTTPAFGLSFEGFIYCKGSKGVYRLKKSAVAFFCHHGFFDCGTCKEIYDLARRSTARILNNRSQVIGYFVHPLRDPRGPRQWVYLNTNWTWEFRDPKDCNRLHDSHEGLCSDCGYQHRENDE